MAQLKIRVSPLQVQVVSAHISNAERVIVFERADCRSAETYSS
jgi:hypothetical protein